MQYAFLIYTDETAPTPEELGRYFAFDKEVKDNRLYVGGHALKNSSNATTVRVRENRPMVHDGPFAETKEQLGGLYVLDCRDLDEAIEYAAKIPGAQAGGVEIRPIMKYQ